MASHQPEVPVAQVPRRPSRRLVTSIGVAVLAAMLAAACGDDDSEPSAGAATTAPSTQSSEEGATSSSATEEDEIDRNGIMRVDLDLTNANSHILDPGQLLISPATMLHHMIYDTLFRVKPDGTWIPSLATVSDQR